MILPTNGKVVVFDDVYDQVEGLLQALSKQRVPYVYYKDETGLDLPDEPIENIRLVFLDLQLVSGQTLSNHNIISSIGGRFERVIEEESNYILVYWSTKETKYQKVLEEAFKGRLQKYKPIISVCLDKVEALKQGDKIIEFITQEIESVTEDFDLFKVFALWENLVNNSAGSLINDFTNFIGKDGNWDENAKHVLYKLSQAYSGKTINNKNDVEKLHDSFSTLNQVLIDQIENSVLPILDDGKDNLKDVIAERKNDKNEYSSLINNKLFLSEMTRSGTIPGCLFFVDEELDLKKNRLDKKYEKTSSNDKIPEEKREGVLKKIKSEIGDFEHYNKGIKKNYNLIINSIITGEESHEKDLLRKNILARSTKIELNISPLCDFAQEKMPCVRLLPGLLVDIELMSSFNKENVYNYFSDGAIKFNGKNYYFLFDFRFLYSKPETVIRERLSQFKLRHQLLSDIQLRLGNHINRSGVIYIQ